MTNVQAEREEFEAWAKTENWPLKRSKHAKFPDEYFDRGTQACWAAWQARASTPATERAGLVMREEVIWQACCHLREEESCNRCPATVETNYGPGKQACRLLAEKCAKDVLAAALTASAPQAQEPSTAMNLLADIIDDCDTALKRDKTMRELLPCPFCGREPHRVRVRIGRYDLTCIACGITLKSKLWNRRTTATKGAAQVKVIDWNNKEVDFKLFKDMVGDGWHNILDRLYTDLVALGWDRVLHQVKEKYGGLRFYIGSSNEGIFDRIRKAEDESFVTCEACGKPGKLRNIAWIKCLCDEHHNKNEELTDVC